MFNLLIGCDYSLLPSLLQNSAVELKDAVNEDNPFIGQADVRQITPPHTVASIVLFIKRREQLPRDAPYQLYTSSSERVPVDNDTILPIFEAPGPGSSSDSPLALVLEQEAPDRLMCGVQRMPEWLIRSLEKDLQWE